MNVLKSIKLWVKALRAPFFQAVIIPTILGATVAWYHTGVFYLDYFLLSLLAVIFVNAGTNLTNDFFDHKSGNDEANKQFTPFSGGSRVIQDGLITPSKIRVVSIVCFFIAIVIGLYLAFMRGWVILVIGMVGVFSGYFYTATPAKIGYSGWGELLAGINCGPLVLLGSYYVQTKTITPEAIIISLPVGLLITAILYINQFPDYSCDKEVNKKTLIVRLGPDKALSGYFILVIFTYLIIGIGTVLRIIPWIALVSFVTLPIAIKALLSLKKYYNSGRKLIPAMGSTIAMHLLIGLLLSGSYITSGILNI